MSTSGIASSILSQVQGSQASNKPSSSTAQASTKSDFSASLMQQIAAFQANSINSLFASASDDSQAASGLDFLNAANPATGSSTDVFSMLGLSATGTQSLSATGRNPALFDPESGYQMMSTINRAEVTYKAQFSELSDMKSGVATLQQAGETLAGVDGEMDNASIKSKLQAFVGQYNDWINRFDGSVKSGGVLAGTNAAEISLEEMEISVENVFNGAKDGMHGLADLGVSIDDQTNLISIDTAKLDAVLSSNKQAAVNTIDEFSANFAKSAELLNSANNVIPHRLDNLDRAIDYISDNKASLQQEFGMGDVAQPADYVSKALSAYNKIGHTG